MTESRTRRVILVACVITAAVVVVESRLAAATLSSRRTDVVVAMFAGAIGLLSLPPVTAHRVGLGVATAALLSWSASVSHPWEGPTLFVFPGELGLGVHLSDVVSSAAIVTMAVWLDRQLRGGSSGSDGESGAVGPISSDR